MQVYLVVFAVVLSVSSTKINYEIDDVECSHPVLGTEAIPFQITSAFFDIDGTIKPATSKGIPPDNTNALMDMKKQGIQLFTATGRCLQQIREIFGSELYSIFSGFVTENGAYVVTKGNKVVFNALETDGMFASAKQFFQSMFEQNFPEELRRGLLYFQNNTVNLTIKPREGTPRNQSVAEVKRLSEAAISWLSTPEGSAFEDVVQMFVHWDALDIVPVGVSKADGIHMLSNVLKVDFNTSVYAGDDRNDPFKDVSFFGIFPVTYATASEYAVNTVSQLGGVVFQNCDSYNLAMCIKNAQQNK